MAPTSASSQGSEDSTLPLSTSGSDASDRSSGTPPVPESSSDTGPTSPDGPMLPPTPTSNQPGGTAEQHLARKARMLDGANRTSVTDLRMAVDQLLPTPRSNADRASRASLTRQGHWSAPSLEQAVEFAEGKLPREYESWDEVQGWTSSAEASPVSRSAPQDDERARTMTDTSGLSSAASSLRFDPDTWSSRTSLVCSLQDGAWVIEQASLFGTTPLATFSETFPRWGSMHDGQVFAHPTPGRVTSESASSSLPTPDTMPDAYTKTPRAAANFETGHAVSLGQRIDHMLHTPTTGDTAPTYDHRASPGYTRAIPVPNLAAQVDDLLPTPRGRDKGTAGDVTGSEMTGGPNLTETVLSLGDRTKPPSEGGNE